MTEGFQRRIRPYLLTGGRTRTDVELSLETQVRSVPPEGGGEGAPVPGLSPEQRAIIELCPVPLAVAEVSARLGLHLQVTKILVGDLITDGHLLTGSQVPTDDRPDLGVLERVLNGLQSL